MSVIPYPVINLQGLLSNPNVALEAAKAGTLDRIGSGIVASGGVDLTASPSTGGNLADRIRALQHASRAPHVDDPKNHN